jgi:L-alanine-DL-glutamate epimerase-like enolase superfamily enzyme
MNLLTIRSEDGIEGHTFAGGPGEDLAPVLLQTVAPMLIGLDASEIGKIWELMGRRGLPASVRGAVDVALWDITGKSLGQPVHRLLGTARREVPVYTSSWVHREAAEYLDEAVAFKERGITGHKIHPPTQLRHFDGADIPVSADIDLCRRLREAVGEDHALFLDAHMAYDFVEALRVGRAAEDLVFDWYEDPLAADDLYGYARLKQHLSIPIMATEATEGGLTALAPWVVERATDFLRGDVVIKGGITGMMKIAHLAEAFHLPCEVHDAYNSLNNLANLHVIMAISNCSWFEALVPHAPGSCDFDSLNYGLAEHLRIDRNGNIHAPTGPGLGIEVDWDLMRSSAEQLTF